MNAGELTFDGGGGGGVGMGRKKEGECGRAQNLLAYDPVDAEVWTAC